MLPHAHVIRFYYRDQQTLHPAGWYADVNVLDAKGERYKRITMDNDSIVAIVNELEHDFERVTMTESATITLENAFLG